MYDENEILMSYSYTYICNCMVLKIFDARINEDEEGDGYGLGVVRWMRAYGEVNGS